MSKSGSKRWWIIGATLVAAGTGISFLRSGSTTTSEVPIFAVQRGNLQINVLQGGEIRALKNFEVKSEIEYPTKIMSLIPEGYMITEDDIKEGKVLVELDGSEIKDKITTHEIDFQTTVAAYIDADETARSSLVRIRVSSAMPRRLACLPSWTLRSISANTSPSACSSCAVCPKRRRLLKSW